MEMGSILKLIEELIITTLRVVIFRIDPGRFQKYPPDFGANGTKVVGRKVRNRTREAKEKRIDEGVYSLGMLFSDIQIYTGEMFHR